MQIIKKACFICTQLHPRPRPQFRRNSQLTISRNCGRCVGCSTLRQAYRRWSMGDLPHILAAAEDSNFMKLGCELNFFYFVLKKITWGKWTNQPFKVMTSRFWWRHRIRGVGKINPPGSVGFQTIITKLHSSSAPTTLNVHVKLNWFQWPSSGARGSWRWCCGQLENLELHLSHQFSVKIECRPILMKFTEIHLDVVIK